MAKRGFLILNLGTPAGPSPKEVGKYLSEFLMDPFVIDIPAPLRWILVNLIIIPKRKFASSLLYKKIWTEQGSPPLLYSNALLKRLRQKMVGDQVELAMRYGEPSIAKTLAKFRGTGIHELIILPLYPQYSLAATESSIKRIEELSTQLLPKVKLVLLPPFYDSEPFLNAKAEVGKTALKGKSYDMALFSFHGLPERHVRKTDTTSEHCLEKTDCSESITDTNKNCYRAQCFHTAREIAKRLNIPKEKYRVCFQSRLNDKWIKPYTDSFYESLPKEGVKRLVVFSPSFVADCLETLEEVSIRGREQFLKAGGEEIFLVPSLNAESVWVDAVHSMLTNQEYTQK